MAAGPNEAANGEVLAGVNSPLRRSKWDLFMYRGSCVYRLGAEPYKLVGTGALDFVTRGRLRKWL